jgi:hypothetical protein
MRAVQSGLPNAPGSKAPSRRGGGVTTLESRARVLANEINRDQLLDLALRACKQKLPVARLFFLAVKIWDEDRSLKRSLKLTNTLGNAVYSLRPRSLPSDGVVHESWESRLRDHVVALIVGMYVTDIRAAYRRHRQFELEREARKFLEEDWNQMRRERWVNACGADASEPSLACSCGCELTMDDRRVKRGSIGP